MNLLEKILLPVDFSWNSEGVIKTAIETAKVFKSEIYLMHVIPDFNIEGISIDMIKENIQKKLSDTGSKIENSGVVLKKIIIEEGTVIRHILSAADLYDVNVIICGSGKSESNGIVGTTALKLIRESVKPVWVVKPDNVLSYDGILAPVDFSNSSKRALKNAIHLARQFKHKLHVITVAKNLDGLFSGIFKPSEEKKLSYIESVSNKFEKFLKEFDFTGVDFRTNMLSGNPHDEIIKYISENDINLTVIGSIGDSKDKHTMIGSVAEKLLRAAPTSFLTVKFEDTILLKMEAELKDIEACTLQGNKLLQNGMPAEALNHYKHCLTIDPLYSRAYNKMAEAYRRMGNEEAAIRNDQQSKFIEDHLWGKKVEAEIRNEKFKK